MGAAAARRSASSAVDYIEASAADPPRGRGIERRASVDRTSRRVWLTASPGSTPAVVLPLAYEPGPHLGQQREGFFDSRVALGSVRHR
jgi:hypothetical protein